MGNNSSKSSKKLVWFRKSLISVEAAFEVSNGMTGMNRDVILRLCTLVEYEENIRSIFGTSEEHMKRKDHNYFVSQRKKEYKMLAGQFLTNGALHVVNTGSRLLWNMHAHSTFMVDTEMTKGAYGITMEKEGGPGINFGLALKGTWTGWNHTNLWMQLTGTCCIGNDSIYCGGTPQVRSTFFSRTGKAVLRLELDTDRHVLYFFVDRAQIPHSVVKVPSLVHFAVSGYNPSIKVDLKSVTKLPRPTIRASVKCAQYRWL